MKATKGIAQIVILVTVTALTLATFIWQTYKWHCYYAARHECYLKAMQCLDNNDTKGFEFWIDQRNKIQ